MNPLKSIIIRLKTYFLLLNYIDTLKAISEFYKTT